MTPEEALECLRNSLFHLLHEEAFEIISSIVQLKIAKKPIPVSDTMAMCPHCYSTVYDRYEGMEHLNICPDCGQIIDWSEEK